MGALDFLAGLGGAYTAIDAGMRAARERQQADEDREFLKAQRGLYQQQQQRQLDEQKRADKLREDLAAIPAVERIDVDLNKANPETSKITIDNEGGPSATQLPAIRTVERPRARDAQLRDAAGAYRRSGDLGRALELESAAHKEMFDRSARNYAQLKANSSSLSAADFVRQAKSIFDSDPFPMEIASVREEPDGMVSFDIRNRDNPAAGVFTYRAKSKREVMEGLESYYSPATYQALVDAKNKAAIEAQAKLAENPFVAVPAGGILVDRSNGRTIADNTNGFVWTGKTNPDGSPEMVRAGRGTAGPAGASPTRDQEIDAALKLALENSPRDARTEEQVAGINRLARQFGAQNPKDSASRVVQAAILATKNPDKIRPKFDDKTGRIVSAIDFEGGNYILQDFGGVASPRDVKPDVMTSIANEYVSSSIPAEDRPLFIAAAYERSGQARSAINSKVTKQAVDNFVKNNGRQPSESELAEITKHSTDQVGPVLDLIGNHLRAEPKRLSEMLSGSGYMLAPDGKVVPASPAPGGAATSPSPSGSAAQPAPAGTAAAAAQAVNGDSPSARWRARQDAAAAERDAAKEAERQELVRQFNQDMVTLSPLDFARKYDPLRMRLPTEQAAQLQLVERRITRGDSSTTPAAALPSSPSQAGAPAGAAATAPSAAAQAAPAQSSAPAARPQFSPAQGATSLPAPAAPQVAAPAATASPARAPQYAPAPGAAAAAARPAAPAQAGASQGSAAPARRADYTPAPGAQAPQAGLGLTPPAAAAAQPAATQAAATIPTQPAQPAQAGAAAPTTPPRDWPRAAGPDGNFYRTPPQKIEISSVAAMRDAVARAAQGGDPRAVEAAQSAIQRARDDFEGYSREVLKFTLLPADAARVRSELARIGSEISQASESNAAAALRLRSGTGATGQARQGAAAGQPAAAPGRPASAPAQGGAPTQAPSRSGAGRGGPTLEQLADGRRRAKIESDIREKEELIQALNEYLATQRQRGNPDRMGVQSAQQDAAQAQRELLELRRQLAR